MGGCMPCEHEYEFNRFCGANVCWKCHNHKGLGNCFCGWSQYGGNGYTNLVEAGEVIDAEPSVGGDE